MVPGLLDTRGKIVKRPVLIIELKTKDGTILEVPALVDSGADRTNVNVQYADELGVKLGLKSDSIGIGDVVVPGRLGNLHFKIKSTDIEMDVPATYIKSNNVSVLLGQEVFFDAFRITFDKTAGRFEITKK